MCYLHFLKKTLLLQRNYLRCHNTTENNALRDSRLVTLTCAVRKKAYPVCKFSIVRYCFFSCSFALTQQIAKSFKPTNVSGADINRDCYFQVRYKPIRVPSDNLRCFTPPGQAISRQLKITSKLTYLLRGATSLSFSLSANPC